MGFLITTCSKDDTSTITFIWKRSKKSPGQFKIEQNYLADKIKQKVLFVPISPEKLNDGLEKLFDYIKIVMINIIKTALMH